MTEAADFFLQALEQVRRAVLAIGEMADLQTGARDLTRGRLSRAGGRLRQVETILRRLILLMALALSLPPVRPRGPAGPGPGPEPELPEGVELAVFPRLQPRRLSLLPPRTPFAGTGQIWDMSGPPGAAPGPVTPWRLMARIAALQRVLAAPEAHARRLARSLERLRKSGEPRPMVGEAESAFRLSPELGVIASLLPGQLRAALEHWQGSG